VSKTREGNLARLREEAYVIEPGQKFVVDAFRPEDAPGVVRLYYAVYGEMFPVDHVYDPEELVRINGGDDLFQVVGRTEKGDVVGLYALFRSAPGRRIMEAGSWIVHPDYRGTSLGLRLIRRIHGNPPERFGLDVIFGQSVCDHVTTQKLARLINGYHNALEIEAMPPRPGEGAGYGRISLLDGIVMLRNRPDEIHLPARYDAQLREIYGWMDLDRTFVPDSAREDDLAAETVLAVKVLDEAELAKIEVESVGAGFAGRLADALGEHPGMYVHQLMLPLWLPGCSVAVEAARREGFFFGGLLPLWFDRDALLMQKVAGTPDFSKPLVHTGQAKAVLRMIVEDWAALRRGD